MRLCRIRPCRTRRQFKTPHWLHWPVAQVQEPTGRIRYRNSICFPRWGNYRRRYEGRSQLVWCNSPRNKTYRTWVCSPWILQLCSSTAYSISQFFALQASKAIGDLSRKKYSCRGLPNIVSHVASACARLANDIDIIHRNEILVRLLQMRTRSLFVTSVPNYSG